MNSRRWLKKVLWYRKRYPHICRARRFFRRHPEWLRPWRNQIVPSPASSEIMEGSTERAPQCMPLTSKQ